MRTCLMITLLFAPMLSWADFDAGTLAYQQSNYSKAFSEFLKEAQSGMPDAQHNVAAMYYRGEGVKKDITRAYAWMTLAAQRGDNDSQAALDVIMFSLTSTQLDAGRKLTRKLALKYNLPFHYRTIH
ncbi:MAG: tetratricopeptide repeat protein [bacterium]